MNYRHAFHAGNFADVMKHATLALVIERLKQKPTPFRVIDTHAGPGAYRLGEGQSERTQEWKDGIGRLLQPGAEPLAGEAAALLEPYLATVRRLNGGGGLSRYPGSPLIARSLLREQDHLLVNELHPEDLTALRRLLARDRQVTVMGLDAWTVLKSALPPKERRGVVLVDPPFEARDEFERIGRGLEDGLRRFRTGTYVVWYPIKDPLVTHRFHRLVARLAQRPVLIAELMLRRPTDSRVLTGCGLAIVNPTYGLPEQLDVLLPALADRLALGKGAAGRTWFAEAA